MSVDAVLSVHGNPYSCGVAKWSMRLARELGVPFSTLDRRLDCHHPLVSMKHAEKPLYSLRPRWESFDLFLHDFVGGPLVDRWWRENHPMRVYAANGVIARELRRYRPDVIEAWCPSTIETPPPRADLTILTFGMAHKLVSPHYQKLKALLEAHGVPYTILLSTGVHEGSPWDEALEASIASLRAIFGERLEVLGFLSDAALDREIRQATACAAFYDPAVRENNTTAHAVVDRNKTLITNYDADSPALGLNILSLGPMGFDLICSGMPIDWSACGDRTWSHLLRTLRAELPCAS